MSYNVMHYSETYSDLRKAVKAARADYLRKVERATPYLPSKQAQEDIEAAEADFKAALEAARAVARPKFEQAVKGMRENIAAPSMEPPTPEMLATLQMLELRDDIDAGEIEAAAKVMGNNDAALKTLRDVLMRKGRVMPSSIKTTEARTSDAVNELSRAASAILQWDGRTSNEISSDASRAYHDYRWGGGAPVPENARAAQWVADIEPRSYYKDTARALAGDDVPTSIIEALDK